MQSKQSRRSFLKRIPVQTVGIGMASSLILDSALYSDAYGNIEEEPDPELACKLETLTRGFKGDVGIYVRHLPTGRFAAIRANELFPTASLIKVSIMLALFDRIDRGELDYHQVLEYDGSYMYKGKNEDILSCFKIGEKIKLSKLIMLMITISDNSASIWNQVVAGTGTHINKVLVLHGFKYLRINSRTPGREKAYEQYGWGQTTPREICELLVKIRQGKAVSPAASEAMYRILARIYWSGEALSQIPPYVQVASKQGALSQSRSEVLLVNAPSGDYVFSVITKNQIDQSWGHDNEGFALISNISKSLWRHFEPGNKWEPTAAVAPWNR